MNTKITSNNQSGGVTGQNVNIGGNVQSAGSTSTPLVEGISWRKTVGRCIGAVGGLITFVLGILEYFDVKLWG
jgi:hypothetical protein